MSVEAQVQVFYRNIELMEATLEWREEGGFLHTLQPLPVGADVQLRRAGMDEPVSGRVTHVVETRKKGRNEDGPPPGMMLAFVGAGLFVQDEELAEEDHVSTKLERPSGGQAAVGGEGDPAIDPDMRTPVVDPDDEDLERVSSYQEDTFEAVAGEGDEDDDADIITQTESLDEGGVEPEEPQALAQTPTLTEASEGALDPAEQAIVDTPTIGEEAAAEESPVQAPAEVSAAAPAEEPVEEKKSKRKRRGKRRKKR